MSDTFSAATAAKIDRVLDKATVIEIEGTSHFLPMERPAEIAKAVADWYENLEFNN